MFLAVLCVIGNDEITNMVKSLNYASKETAISENETKTETERGIDYQPSVASEFVDIPVNLPTAFSNLTKNEILDIRKKYVATSLFANQNYTPSESVFGSIEDNKPWISTNLCHKPDEPLRTDGVSEEARFINNPTILVG